MDPYAHYYRKPEELERFFSELEGLQTSEMEEFRKERLEVFRRLCRSVLSARGMVSQLSPMSTDILRTRDKRPYQNNDDLRALSGCALTPDFEEDPTHDITLMSGLRLWSYKLQIAKGAPKNPRLGQAGMWGVFQNLDNFRKWAPTPEEIVHREMELLEAVSSSLALNGVAVTRAKARMKYGLTEAEVSELITLARTLTVAVHYSTAEENMAMMTKRLESILLRARKAMDLRMEMMALKFLGQIQGLSNVSEEEKSKALIKLLQTNPLPEIADSPKQLPE